jgi:hypothetical protein
MQTTEQPFKIGDRVALKACSQELPGTVRDITRRKVIVVFDDMGEDLWIIRPANLRRVPDAGR